ncbi:DUF2807 domain-containing protein [Sphingorhabdus sp.]|uniref:GIN domain-containing protein n=1 Tax=Sphingorhabdus sp. TaxID=1902408 RepID=UPI0032B75E1C
MQRPIGPAILAIGISLMLSQTPYSARAATKSFLVGSFDELIVEGDIIVKLDNMKAPSAKASGDHSLVEALKIERNGLTIKIRVQDYEGTTQKAKIGAPLVVTLGGRGVRKVSVDGSAQLDINQIRAPGMVVALKMSGAGQINVGKIESDRVEVNLAGTGGINIASGKIRAARLSVSGSGKMDASKMPLMQAVLFQQGNATTHLLINEKVEISNSGSGTIQIDGSATCFVRQPGSAKIVCGKTAQ